MVGSQRHRACVTHRDLSGHGDHHCSEFVSRALPAEIARNSEKYPGRSISAILEKSFVDVDDSITGPLQQCFKSSISWTKTKARKQKAVDDLLEQNGTLVDLALRARAGSTALVAVISPEHIHVANVGDCRASKNVFK
jgi:serine/threonine protein phosphatase PrpC